MAPPNSVDAVVTRTLNETKPGEDEHRVRVRRFDKAYNIYRATPPQPLKRDDFSARVRVPFAMQVIDTALVNMVSGNKPQCKVTARSPVHEANEKAFGHVFDYYTDRDDLVGKEPLIVQSGLIFGVAVGKTHWLYKEGQQTVRSNGQSVQQPAVIYNGPSFEPWDAYDCWWDPNGRDVNNCAWIALRSWPSKDELLRSACKQPPGHDYAQCDGIYHNVDQLLSSGTAPKTTYTAQERFLGGQQNLRKDRFKVVEYWRDDRITVIGNDVVLLRDEPNPHWHGKKPVVIACTRPDLHKMQGIPETELIDHIQQALWTNMNLRMENEHFTVWRGFTYRLGGIVDEDAIQIKPRALIGVTDHDDLRPIDVQALPPEAYKEEESLLSLMQLVTGINPYISGSQSTGVDNNTATGVSVLSEVASRLLKFKAARIKWRVWQPTYEQWGADIQQYMDEPLWVKLTGPGHANGADVPGEEASWHQYDPDQVAGEFDFQLEGTDDAISKQQDRSDAMALLNACVPLAQLGIVNMSVVLEKVARAFGIENPTEILNQTQAQPPAAPVSSPPGANGGSPMQPQPPAQISPGQGQNQMLDPQVQQLVAQSRGLT